MTDFRALTETAQKYVSNDPALLALAACSDDPLGWIVSQLDVFVGVLPSPWAGAITPVSLDLSTLIRLNLFALPGVLPPRYAAAHKILGYAVYRDWAQVVDVLPPLRQGAGKLHAPTLEFLFGGRFDGGSENSSRVAVAAHSSRVTVVRNAGGSDV